MKKNFLIVILTLILLWLLVMWGNQDIDIKQKNTQIDSLTNLNDSLRNKINNGK
jgi:hypothetical protein